MPTEKECREIVDKTAEVAKNLVDKKGPSFFKDSIKEAIDKNKERIAKEVCKEYKAKP